MAGLIVRPAVRADIEAYHDLPGAPTIRAVVGEIDGRLVGIGGFALAQGGRWFAFVDLLEEARAHKIAILRAAKRLLAEARRDGIKYIYAETDPGEPRAALWLASLGFEAWTTVRPSWWPSSGRGQKPQHYYRWSGN
jgi:N-acetylglutamate synthase-like GNAT family acetyltransferase